ncbi:hypothetical protein NKH52_15885 [Mesorhizobium sp. M1066]|uniref:hypothetical protein n=1 Tax=unclassified Mesorhizobium TaxID=325217 RepID=UPI0033392E5A
MANACGESVDEANNATEHPIASSFLKSHAERVPTGDIAMLLLPDSKRASSG